MGDWEFDNAYWPDPEKMCEELAQMGVNPIVSVWPAINDKSKHYKEMSENGMLVTIKDGRECLLDFLGKQTYIDPTNPATRKFQWDTSNMYDVLDSKFYRKYDHFPHIDYV